MIQVRLGNFIYQGMRPDAKSVLVQIRFAVESDQLHPERQRLLGVLFMKDLINGG